MLDDAERARKQSLFAALAADRQRRHREAEAGQAEEAGLDGERRHYTGSMTNMFRMVWSVLKPGSPLHWSWHYEYLAEHLELLYQRQTRYLIVNIPPRTGKTELMSVAFPCWVWARDPLPSFIGASFDGPLAERFNERRRRIIRSAEYQRLFGRRVTIAKGLDKVENFANTAGGEMRATSPGGNVTGRGGDFLLMDDILPPKAVESPAVSSGVFEWLDETFKTRRNDIGRSPIGLIEQRTGESDMTAHLLKTLPDEDRVHITIPLVAEERAEYVFPISKRVHVREVGDVLLPQIFTDKAVRELRLASRVFQTQYQQKPVAREGKIFKREWFKFYGPKDKGYERDLPKHFDEASQSWDATFKDRADSDLVAGHVWGRVGADKYLVDRRADRLSFTGTLGAIVGMRAKHPYARRILIEDKANGPAIIDVLKSKVSGIVAVEPIGSKIARAEAASVDVEAGNVWLPCKEYAPWIDEFLTFICGFPGPLNDDDVDAMTQALNKMSPTNTGILDFYKRMQVEPEPIISIFEQASEF